MKKTITKNMSLLLALVLFAAAVCGLVTGEEDGWTQTSLIMAMLFLIDHRLSTGANND